MTEFFLAGLFIYLALTLFMYLNQRTFVYFPDPRTQDRQTYNAADMQVIEVQTADGLRLAGWYRPPQGDRPVIVVFHGNASHMGLSALKVRALMDVGYGALLPAYRGYAGNPGKPTEEGLYRDAAAFIDWLKEDRKIPRARIVLLGESLGSGIAVEMAVTKYSDVAGVILESPYTSFVDMARRQYFFVPFLNHLVRDRFDTLAKIGKLSAPLLVVHGRRDLIVPFSQGQAVFDAASAPKKFAIFDNAGHNDLYAYGAGDVVLEFLAGLEKGSSDAKH